MPFEANHPQQCPPPIERRANAADLRNLGFGNQDSSDKGSNKVKFPKIVSENQIGFSQVNGNTVDHQHRKVTSIVGRKGNLNLVKSNVDSKSNGVRGEFRNLSEQGKVSLFLDGLTDNHKKVLQVFGVDQSGVVETIIKWRDSNLTLAEAKEQAALGTEEQLPKLEVVANDLSKMNDQELQDLVHLDPEALNKVGLTELAGIARHKDRLVGVASGVVEDIIAAGGDFDETQKIVEAATGKRSPVNAANILALTEVGLIAAAAATKEKKLRSALLAAALAVSISGCANGAGPTAEATGIATNSTKVVSTPVSASTEISPSPTPTLLPMVGIVTPTPGGLVERPKEDLPKIVVRPVGIEPLSTDLGFGGVKLGEIAAYCKGQCEIQLIPNFRGEAGEVVDPNLIRCNGVVVDQREDGRVLIIAKRVGGGEAASYPAYFKITKDGLVGSADKVEYEAVKIGQNDTVLAEWNGEALSLLLVSGEDGSVQQWDYASGQWVAYSEIGEGMTLDADGNVVENNLTPKFNVDINRYPESIEDVAGVVRWDESDPDKLRGDLAILHQEILEALEAEGVTADQLPYFQIGDVAPNASSQARAFSPSEFNGEIQIIDMNNERPVRVVLTKLDTGDGYVLTIPVDSNNGSGKIIMVDFVINVKLMEELDMKRKASGSGYELINEAFIKETLIPNLEKGFTPDFFGPFGELRDEYLRYKGMLVEADSNTDEDEIFRQIEEGKMFLVEKCNIYY